MSACDDEGQDKSRESSGHLVGRSILVVEDDAFIALEIENSLKEQGAVVIGPANCVSSAIEFIKKSKIDAAILDVNLAQEMVFPVADLLVDLDIPVVFQTAISSTEAIEALYPKAKVLKKPTYMFELLNCVAILLEPA